MIKSILFSMVALLACSGLLAQDSARLTAKKFLNAGDYNNAILVLNRASQADEENLGLKKDLAFAYYLSRDYTKALETARPLIERRDTDIQSFQILGMTYKAIEERKEAEKMYKTALRKFPQSGALRSEYGEVLWANGDVNEAIAEWRSGIQLDPNYSGNYYHAAKYYFGTADKVWALLYGEIFVNLESYSKRTSEIKSVLLEGYKKLFTDADMTRNQEKNDFTRAFLETMKNQDKSISSGVTPESLSALRTRFILDWYRKYAAKYPFRLFDYHRQLAKEGMFDAYNQWIFGAAENLPRFQQWCSTHAESYSKFNTFQKNRVFKLPRGEYYHNK